jgi:hypothetical protein
MFAMDGSKGSVGLYVTVMNSVVVTVMVGLFTSIVVVPEHVAMLVSVVVVALVVAFLYTFLYVRYQARWSEGDLECSTYHGLPTPPRPSTPPTNHQQRPLAWRRIGRDAERM